MCEVLYFIVDRNRSFREGSTLLSLGRRLFIVNVSKMGICQCLYDPSREGSRLFDPSQEGEYTVLQWTYAC